MLSVRKILYYYIILKTDIGNHLDLGTIWTWEPYGHGNVFDRNHMDLGVLLTGIFWQEPYGPGPIFPGTFLVGTFLAGTFR
jgi:hypothetical protein